VSDWQTEPNSRSITPEPADPGQPATTATPGAPNARFIHLDGVRGIASLVVVLSHYVLAMQPSMYRGTLLNTGRPHFAAALTIARTPLTVFFQPEFAVAIFFALSGFVLAASVTARPRSWGELALRRWLRLSLPILATSLLIWLWLLTGFHPERQLAAQNHSGWLATSYTWTLWQANDLRLVVFQSLFDEYLRDNHLWNVVLWTMPIELWGSLGLFAAYLATRPGWRLPAACIATLLTWNTDYMNFAAGAVLFELWRMCPDRRLPKILAWLVGFPLLLLALLLGGAPYYAPTWTPYWMLTTWVGGVTSANPILQLHRIGAVLLVAAVLILPAVQALLRGWIGRKLGRISFMIYLLHVPILCGVIAWLVLRLTPLVGYNAATVLGLPMFLAAVLASATLAAHWFDEPGINFARREAARVAAWAAHARQTGMASTLASTLASTVMTRVRRAGQVAAALPEHGASESARGHAHHAASARSRMPRN